MKPTECKLKLPVIYWQVTEETGEKSSPVLRIISSVPWKGHGGEYNVTAANIENTKCYNIDIARMEPVTHVALIEASQAGLDLAPLLEVPELSAPQLEMVRSILGETTQRVLDDQNVAEFQNKVRQAQEHPLLKEVVEKAANANGFNWAYKLGMTVKGKRYNIYRDEVRHCQKESHDGKTLFFIDEDDREFSNEEELTKALNEKLKNQ